MWYFERYQNHNKAENHARKLLPELERKCLILHETKSYPPAELEFITEACKEAIRCSAMLKWTYAYGYYCVDGSKNPAKKNLYEFNQEDLEKYSQDLFKQIESDLSRYADDSVIDKKDFYLFKDKLVSLTAATANYYVKLGEHIEKDVD